MIELVKVGISCKQHKADAGYLIMSATITIITTASKQLVVVGIDSDHLVMLVAL